MAVVGYLPYNGIMVGVPYLLAKTKKAGSRPDVVFVKFISFFLLFLSLQDAIKKRHDGLPLFCFAQWCNTLCLYPPGVQRTNQKRLANRDQDTNASHNNAPSRFYKHQLQFHQGYLCSGLPPRGHQLFHENMTTKTIAVALTRSHVSELVITLFTLFIIICLIIILPRDCYDC
jgi:hypothetical protein